MNSCRMSTSECRTDHQASLCHSSSHFQSSRLSEWIEESCSPALRPLGNRIRQFELDRQAFAAHFNRAQQIAVYIAQSRKLLAPAAQRIQIQVGLQNHSAIHSFREDIAFG